jgi:hypothetical protein
MKYLRAGICALAAFSVLAHGAVEEWSQAILETGAGLLLVAWAVRYYFKREEKIVFSPLLPPLTVFCLVVFAQWLLRWTASPYDTRM